MSVGLPHNVCTFAPTMSVRVCRVMVSSTANMHAFATNAIAYLRHYNFDGLDLNWEYPAARGSPPGDKQRFTELLQVTVVRLLTYFILGVCGCA